MKLGNKNNQFSFDKPSPGNLGQLFLAVSCCLLSWFCSVFPVFPLSFCLIPWINLPVFLSLKLVHSYHRVVAFIGSLFFLTHTTFLPAVVIFVFIINRSFDLLQLRLWISLDHTPQITPFLWLRITFFEIPSIVKYLHWWLFAFLARLIFSPFLAGTLFEPIAISSQAIFDTLIIIEFIFLFPSYIWPFVSSPDRPLAGGHFLQDSFSHHFINSWSILNLNCGVWIPSISVSTAREHALRFIRSIWYFCLTPTWLCGYIFPSASRAPLSNYLFFPPATVLFISPPSAFSITWRCYDQFSRTQFEIFSLFLILFCFCSKIAARFPHLLSAYRLHILRTPKVECFRKTLLSLPHGNIFFLIRKATILIAFMLFDNHFDPRNSAASPNRCNLFWSYQFQQMHCMAK